MPINFFQSMRMNYERQIRDTRARLDLLEQKFRQLQEECPHEQAKDGCCAHCRKQLRVQARV